MFPYVCCFVLHTCVRVNLLALFLHNIDECNNSSAGHAHTHTQIHRGELSIQLMSLRRKRVCWIINRLFLSFMRTCVIEIDAFPWIFHNKFFRSTPPTHTDTHTCTHTNSCITAVEALPTSQLGLTQPAVWVMSPEGAVCTCSACLAQRRIRGL